ncbi:MAG: OmpH family outer membrane protein [Lentisphaerae bacterium]|nr:OmpH family outer membrane protein [Lentisphaerota bacterium]
MNLRHSISILCAAMAFAMAAPAPAADFKVAFINMKRVFDEYYKTKKANTEFKARADTVELERKEKVNALKAIKAELENMAADVRDTSLSDSERDKKRKLAETKLSEFKDAEEELALFERTKQKGLGQDMQEKQQELVEEIRAIIASRVKAKGITMVLDSSGKTFNNTEAVIYYDETLDITDEIVALVNKDAPEGLDAKDQKKPAADKEPKGASK